MQRFLVIQTAFIGDVVLASAVPEKLHQHYPDATIDFLLRKGNEGLLSNHPFIRKVHVWDKATNKQRNLWKIAMQVRREKYTHVINLHRFATSGLITFLSGAKHRIGFDKNPLSFFYTQKKPHIISDPYAENPVHEVERNQLLIEAITDSNPARPRLYPSIQDFESVIPYKKTPYICIAPSSVWYTKQYPPEKWAELIKALPDGVTVYLVGGKSDMSLADEILQKTQGAPVVSLMGKLNFLQSAALMKDAVINYANDSAPLHFASAMNAPITAVYCSTVPAFGFGPLSEKSKIVEVRERLYCRPCGLHGHKQCPEGHFRCALDIKTEDLQ